MIKLTKTDEPDILAQNSVAWTTEYVTHNQNGTDIPEGLKNNYRKSEIKEQLRQETHDKCAYCESKVSHIYPGDVEHIVPKSVFPEKVFLWKNLTYSCYTCNNNKRDYHSDTASLLNPYVDEPSVHLRAYGSAIFHLNGSIKGETTVGKLKLNRAGLVERRTERLESLNHLIARWHSETDEQHKQVLLEQIKEEALADKEYSFAVRHYIQDRMGISF